MQITIGKRKVTLKALSWGDTKQLSEMGVRIADFGNMSHEQMTTLYLYALNVAKSKGDDFTAQDIECLNLGHDLFNVDTIKFLLDSKPDPNS